MIFIHHQGEIRGAETSIMQFYFLVFSLWVEAPTLPQPGPLWPCTLASHSVQVAIKTKRETL